MIKAVGRLLQVGVAGLTGSHVIHDLTQVDDRPPAKHKLFRKAVAVADSRSNHFSKALEGYRLFLSDLLIDLGCPLPLPGLGEDQPLPVSSPGNIRSWPFFPSNASTDS